MQLKIQRSQRLGGLTGSTVHFCLDVRADYTPAERESIRRYKIGSQIVYASRAARRHTARGRAHLAYSAVESGSQAVASVAKSLGSLALARLHLNVSIASLGRGHHIECRDLEEMMEAEGELRESCKNVSGYLAVAETFNGTEVVIGYDNGQETVELRQNAPPLLSYDGPVATIDHEPNPIVGRDPVLRAVFGALAWVRSLEERAMGELDGRGWIVHRTHLRIAAGIAGVLILYLGYHIL